jgi:hypothetical protein
MGRREISLENHIDQPQKATNDRGAGFLYMIPELVLCFRPFIYCSYVFR